MKLINTQLFDQGLHPGGLIIFLPKGGIPVELTESEEAAVRKHYSLDDLPRYGIIAVGSDTTPPQKAPAGSAPIAAGGDIPKGPAPKTESPAADAKGSKSDPETEPQGAAQITLRDIQAKIRSGKMTREEAETLLEQENSLDQPRATVLKELQKALK